MKKYNCKKFKLLVLSLFFASWTSSSWALIPVTDPLTFGQGVINNLKLAIESSFVVQTMRLAGTMNTTIGQATNTFSDYVKDKIKLEGGKLGIGSDNGYFVFANELGDFCSLSTADTNEITKKENMVKCMKQLTGLRASSTMSDQKTARDIYVRSYHEMTHANAAESLVHRSFAVNFEKEILEPMAEKAKQAKTVRDDYAVIINSNKEFAGIVNRILMLQSSKVAADSFRDYGDFEIYPEDVLELN